MTLGQEYTDEQAVRRVLVGHTDAFGLLVRRHMLKAEAVAAVLVGDLAAGAEVAQLSMQAAFSALRALRDPARFAPWLIALVREQSVEWRRSHLEQDTQGRSVDLDSPDALLRRIAALPPKQAETIAAAMILGLDAENAARLLDMSRRAFEKRFEQARAALGESLSGIARIRLKAVDDDEVRRIMASLPTDAYVRRSPSRRRGRSWVGRVVPLVLLALMAAAGAGFTLWRVAEYRGVHIGSLFKWSQQAPPSNAPKAPNVDQSQERNGRVNMGPSIRGRVVDSRGKPIAGAMIRAYGVAEDPLVTFSASDGSFGLWELPGESYALRVRGDGYLSESMANVVTGATDLTITLRGCAAAEGRVVHADTGHPVEQYTVEYMGRTLSVHNARGAFSLENMDPTTPLVTIIAPGFIRRPCNIEGLRPETVVKDVTIDLSPMPILEGRVTTEEGTPLAGVGLFANTLPLSRNERRRLVLGETDEQGTFRVESAYEFPKLLIALHPNYAPGFSSVVGLRHQKSAKIDFTLVRGGAIEGVVYDHVSTRDGRRAYSIRVELNYGSEGSSVDPVYARMFARLDEDGRFALDNLPPGEAGLFAELQHLEYEGNVANEVRINPASRVEVRRVRRLTKRLTIVNGETQHLDFTFERVNATASGQFLFRGEPLYEGGSVSMRILSPEGESRIDAGANGGVFDIGELPPGEAEVWCSAIIQGHEVLRGERVTLVEGETTTMSFDFAGATLSGTVEGYAKDESLNVYILEGDVDTHITREMNVVALANLVYDGFVAYGLKPGTYTILARSVKPSLFPYNMASSTWPIDQGGQYRRTFSNRAVPVVPEESRFKFREARALVVVDGDGEFNVTLTLPERRVGGGLHASGAGGQETQEDHKSDGGPS